MLFKLLLVSTVLGGSAPRADCRSPINPSQRVDTTLVHVTDVTADGSPDTVRVHLTAPRFDAPFTREFSIVSRGRVLFTRSTVEQWLDSTLKDTSFGLPCSGYLQCKCEW